MSVRNPQKIPAGLDRRVFSMLNNAVPALVHPTVNPIVAGMVPALIEAIDKAIPEADAAARGALHAGLWLLADDLPKAHAICQDIPTTYGSAWHAQLHRREGDFSNSKYWWRRAYDLTWKTAANPPMHEQAWVMLRNPPRELAPWYKELVGTYDPAKFVDIVERYHNEPNPALIKLLVEIQRLEWGTLFLETYAAAGGE